MLKQTLLVAALVAACTGVYAQSTPAKKELVARILKIQQPGIETMARELAKQPASELMANAVEFLQVQVPPEKREALAKGLQQDADKYMNETYPLVRDRALRLAPTTVGPLLEEKFSEEELKQVVAMMESPVYLKFQGLGGEMQRVLVNKLVPDLKPEVAPKLRALDEAFAKRLGVQTGAAAPAPAPKASAKK
ncbi:MAG: hypothetical protein ACO1PB_06850 [Ramlibacter sp.]